MERDATVRDLLDGLAAPWAGSSQPPRAKQLEGLRDWLRRSPEKRVFNGSMYSPFIELL